MEVTPRELRYYQTRAGTVVFRNWLTGLVDIRTRARIRIRLDRVEEGNLGDHRGVGEGVMELRWSFGPGYRVYFAEDGPVIIVLLCGGDKRSQNRDVRAAKAYWRDYQARGGRR